jgi:hypothetical protein
MAANKYGIDVAGMYKDVNAIKGGRTQNKLSALNLSEQERVIAERPEKERLAAERANMLTDLRGGAVAGDQGAVQQLMAIDPDGGAKFMEALGKMDDRKIEATKRTVDEIGKTVHGIMNIKDPAKQADVYKRFYDQATPEIKAGLSPTYNQNEMTLALNKAMTLDQILENPKSISVGGRDDVYKLGKKIDSGVKPVKDSKGGKGGSGGSLNSSGESLMYKQAMGYFNPMKDPITGELTILANDTPKAQAITAEATKIFSQLGNISRSTAVEMAAKKYGIDMADKDKPVAEGQRIVNQATGEIMILSNGKWVPLNK